MNPNHNLITENAIAYIKTTLSGAEGGHDWWHTYRVLRLSQRIAKKEMADMLVCELGALFHDIADPKFHDGDEKKAVLCASEFLARQRLQADVIKKIVDIIANISFKGGFNRSHHKSLELKVVQDADRLDAIGAIGIARTFHYGGFKNRKIYDPDIKPKKYSSRVEYRKSDTPSINHFYEKLLLLKDLMNTETGKKIALGRHQYLKEYLVQFFDEWEGKK